MLVYGDHCESADPGERLGALADKLGQVAAMPPGIERHAKLVGALVDAGRLQQGVADAGGDDRPLGEFVLALAHCMLRSWDSNFAELGDVPPVPRAVLPDRVELRLPEGFAFYAVYPEAYAAAARRLTLSGAPRVIGIRSIGTTLGAAVAAALGAPAPVTVRPFGDPFARQVELPGDLIPDNSHYVIVDEGPGLSGSSFGAVADALEARGVPLERMAFLPSHSGEPGPQASDAHRLRWRHAQRVPAEFDAGWLERLFGPLGKLCVGERLKFRARRDGGILLLKFAGLGEIGERKMEMARTLHAAGFTPEPLGLVHGFLIERWCEDARQMEAGEKPVEELGRYIGARAKLFSAPESSGASIEELITMSRRNVSLAMGAEAAKLADGWNADALQKRVARVRTDNKLDRDKWLRLGDGSLLKTDALDHHQAHDLIGCQDMAWDLAGAIVEFALSRGEAERLIAAAEQPVDRELLAFCRLAYPAFRLGQAKLNGAAGKRYARAIHLLLQERSHCRNPQESSFD